MMEDFPEEWIPLLSVKPMKDFTPEDYKAYVRGLLNRPVKKIKAIKLKKPFKWSLTKKGNLSVSVTRKPKWLTRAEVDQISAESGFPENEVWLKVTSKRGGVSVYDSEEQAREVMKQTEEIPW